ncbi:MAG: DUF3040 domain-containing protein [Terrimesophilobacter sp.]
MPLSEQEQRLLEEMERGLYSNDADFVATISNGSSRPNYRMIVIGILVGVVGVVTIVVGIATRLPIIGILGFVVMFVGALLALTRSKTVAVASETESRPGAQNVGFMARMNDRWDKRQEEHGN